MNLKQIYTQVITENSRAKYNNKIVENPSFIKEGENPSCGDDIILSAYVNDDIVIDVGYTGNGCAISRASANIMIDLIKGMKIDEAKGLIDLFIRMIRGEHLEEDELDKLEDARALEGISSLPTRTKCATLAWHTLKEGLDMIEKK